MDDSGRFLHDLRSDHDIYIYMRRYFFKEELSGRILTKNEPFESEETVSFSLLFPFFNTESVICVFYQNHQNILTETILLSVIFANPEIVRMSSIPMHFPLTFVKKSLF